MLLLTPFGQDPRTAIPVLNVRLLIPWRGVWIAECDLDLGSDAPMPTGKQSLTVGTGKMIGTIDPKGTGRFGEKATARLVAGGAGWDNLIGNFHFHNDAPNGVSSAQVLAATAADCGESVVDPTPIFYGPDYVRVSGPAAWVLEGRQYYVGADGVTQVAPWPTIVVGTDVDVLERDPIQRRLVLAADEVVWPGTVITDIRFGTLTVRDVEQTFHASGGSRCAIYSADAQITRIGAALRSVGTTFSGVQWLKVYTYRVVKQGVDGRVQLQAVNKIDGVPDTLPLSVWAGIPGLTTKTKYTLGTLVEVHFANGDPSKPRVVSFDPTPPAEIHLDAVTLLELGAGATSYAAQATLVDAINTAASTLATANSVFAVAISTFAGFCTGPTPPQLGALTTAATTFEAAVTTFVAAVRTVAASLVKVK